MKSGDNNCSLQGDLNAFLRAKVAWWGIPAWETLYHTETHKNYVATFLRENFPAVMTMTTFSEVKGHVLVNSPQALSHARFPSYCRYLFRWNTYFLSLISFSAGSFKVFDLECKRKEHKKIYIKLLLIVLN